METPNALLPYGFVYVYGDGTASGVLGNQFTNTLSRFGTIYGVGVNMGLDLIGQSVGFDSRRIECQLAYAGYPYSVIAQDAILCTEVSPP